MAGTTVLLTGAGGEIGHALTRELARRSGVSVVALDLKPLHGDQGEWAEKSYEGDILDLDLLDTIFADHEIDAVFHLAAMLSTSGERNPERAFQVNVDGTMNLIERAARQGRKTDTRVRFLFPSSIAVYGMGSLESKRRAGAVSEDDYLQPITMYGVNKLASEHVGRYYSNNYGMLTDSAGESGLDFRSLRYPGLISAETVPSGGTSDYIPEMLHTVARGEPYACFARQDTRIPFMTMPDAVDSILALYEASEESLTRRVYNVGAFAPSAGEVAELLANRFDGAEVVYEVHPQRQNILDSWPEDVDDAAARNDWGYAPKHDLLGAFDQYLIPGLRSAESHA